MSLILGQVLLEVFGYLHSIVVKHVRSAPPPKSNHLQYSKIFSLRNPHKHRLWGGASELSWKRQHLEPIRITRLPSGDTRVDPTISCLSQRSLCDTAHGGVLPYGRLFALV